MILAKGQVILERYEIADSAEAEGLTDVYHAVRAGSSNRVVVRLLKDTGDPDLIQRFNNEALQLAQVRHPCIVSMQDFGVVSGNVRCIVTEAVPGPSLKQALQQQGSYPWDDAIEITVSEGTNPDVSDFNAAVVSILETYPTDGSYEYYWPSGSGSGWKGTTQDIYYLDTLVAEGDPYNRSYCVGLTWEVFMRAFDEKVGQLARLKTQCQKLTVMQELYVRRLAVSVLGAEDQKVQAERLEREREEVVEVALVRQRPVLADVHGLIEHHDAHVIQVER